MSNDFFRSPGFWFFVGFMFSQAIEMFGRCLGRRIR